MEKRALLWQMGIRVVCVVVSILGWVMIGLLFDLFLTLVSIIIEILTKDLF